MFGPWLTALAGLSGHADVAAMIALTAGAVYAFTPVAQRGEATRLWGMVALALLASLLAAGIGAGLTVALGYFMIEAIAEQGLGVGLAPWIALIFATCVRAAVYFAVFAAGWSLVKPRDELAEA
jgi:hypothetical protein